MKSRPDNPEPRVYRNAKGLRKSRTQFYLSDRRMKFIARRMQKVLVRKPDETWSELAARIGISQGTIRYLRHGTQAPSLGLLLIICDWSGKTPNWFLDYKEKN